jgi:hypothetical protein
MILHFCQVNSSNALQISAIHLWHHAVSRLVYAIVGNYSLGNSLHPQNQLPAYLSESVHYVVMNSAC